jgi:POT family proton-dependent oligopeptide transporter
MAVASEESLLTMLAAEMRIGYIRFFLNPKPPSLMPETPSEEFASPAATRPGGARAAGIASDATFFGHPRGLSTLFFTEMWERFSYYGLRAILILFMTATVADGGLGFEVSTAAAIVGVYTAAVYLMALPGGWIADRIIGQRRAVFLGGVIIAAGHFSMAIPQLATFYLGLLLIVLGTGLLKPNISAMVGELYPADAGARRDAGFSLFYMGINLGAFLAPLIVGGLGEKVNWHLGFAMAGVGMVLGLIQYVLGGKYLGDAGLHPDATEMERAANMRKLMIGLALFAALIAALIVFGVSVETIAGAGTAVIVGSTVLYFAYVLIAGNLTREEKGRVGAIAVFFVAAAVFWAGFEQASTSFNLVAERLTNLNFFGWEMPASWLQSANPFFIIALAPVFAWLWVWLSKRNAEPSSPRKFSGGLILLGIGFLVIMVGTLQVASGSVTRMGVGWLVLTYLLHSCGELALSPVGLSTVTKLSPHRMVGQMMGIWFMATSLGNLIAGLLAARIGAVDAASAGAVSPDQAASIFTFVAAVSIGAGLLLLVGGGIVKRMMGGVK